MKVTVRKDGRIVIDCDPPCADRLTALLDKVAYSGVPLQADIADARGMSGQIKAARMIGYQPVGKEAHS